MPLFPRLLTILGLAAVLPTGPGSAEETRTRAPIWELRGDEATVYLAGSVHLLRESDLPIPAPFDEVYERSDRLVFELDIAEMKSPATARKIRSQGLLPGGESLSDHFDAETVAAVKAYAAELGLPGAAIERMRPGTVFITLTSLAARHHGARSDLGIEMHFFEKAQRDGKPTSGLETMAFQMSLFHQFKIETLQRLIREMLAEKDEAAGALDEIIAAWKSGDPKQIEDIIVAELAEEEEVKSLLLDQRNRNWIPEIETALTGSETVLFLVGAAHLAGESSVIDLLEKRGHTPVQLTFPPPIP